MVLDVSSRQQQDHRAKLQSTVKGTYPHSVWNQDSQDIVLVEVHVDAMGRVIRAQALFGSRRLFQAAESAARESIFTPASRGTDKEAIEDVQIVSVEFQSTSECSV